MTENITFQGINAVKLENGEICAVVIPELGGKVASLYSKIKDFELFFQCSDDLKSLELYSDFAEFGCWGFDDTFPNIAEGEVTVGGRQVKYPDHGEIWTMPFDYKLGENSVELWAESSILPYTYKKTLSISGNKLEMKYAIENTGGFPFPCIWTMHGLLNCREDMEIKFPPGTNEVENVGKSGFLGDIGTVHPYPVTRDLMGMCTI